MSGSGREAIPDIREWLGIAGRPSQMSGNSRKALPDVREWS